MRHVECIRLVLKNSAQFVLLFSEGILMLVQVLSRSPYIFKFLRIEPLNQCILKNLYKLKTAIQIWYICIWHLCNVFFYLCNIFYFNSNTLSKKFPVSCIKFNHVHLVIITIKTSQSKTFDSHHELLPHFHSIANSYSQN